jgi:hypothetical protein
MLDRSWLSCSVRRSSNGGTSRPRSFFVPFAGIFATPFRIVISRNCWSSEAWRSTTPRSAMGSALRTPAIDESKQEGVLRKRCRHPPVQYLNNILEQDHRTIKKRIRAKQHFRAFSCARRTIQGYETMYKIGKGPVGDKGRHPSAEPVHRSHVRPRRLNLLPSRADARPLFNLCNKSFLGIPGPTLISERLRYRFRSGTLPEPATAEKEKNEWRVVW